MKQFVVIYYAPASAMEKMQNTSPEEMKKEMEAWMTWAEKCGEHLVDLGTPLGTGQQINASGNLPSKTNVTGYSILQADNMAEAEDLLKGHPHLEWADGCQIEVHEKMPLPKC
ncbi:hypothetical protein MnTg01_00707 [archaeon MnTg01]|nr:hypothetical protein MnTg01_00707 [archaeon MnTg01]